jgi:hypothetical protein
MSTLFRQHDLDKVNASLDELFGFIPDDEFVWDIRARRLEIKWNNIYARRCRCNFSNYLTSSPSFNQFQIYLGTSMTSSPLLGSSSLRSGNYQPHEAGRCPYSSTNHSMKPYLAVLCVDQLRARKSAVYGFSYHDDSGIIHRILRQYFPP